MLPKNVIESHWTIQVHELSHFKKKKPDEWKATDQYSIWGNVWMLSWMNLFWLLDTDILLLN